MSPWEITSSTLCVNEGNGDFRGPLGMGTGRPDIKMHTLAMPHLAHTEDWMAMLFKVVWQIMQNASWLHQRA